jgi:hypothetical protein
VDALVVVSVQRLVDRGGDFAERAEPIRIAKVDLELVVAALVIPVLPAAAFLAPLSLKATIRHPKT